jgi:3-phosphoglycerate kinase
LEKIILVNSFVDTFERILLVGEIGLVGLYTLGLYPGLVERSNKNIEDYAKLKDFMLEVFKKAANKKCKIILPTDLICAQKSVLEDIVIRNSGGADSKVGGANDGQAIKPPDNSISNKFIKKQYRNFTF